MRCPSAGVIVFVTALAFVLVLTSPGVTASPGTSARGVTEGTVEVAAAANVGFHLVQPMMDYAVVPPWTSFQFYLTGEGFDAAQYAFDGGAPESPCYSYWSDTALYNGVCDPPGSDGMHVLEVDALGASEVVASRTFVLFVDPSVAWPLDTVNVNVVLIGFDEPAADLQDRLYAYWWAMSQVTEDPATTLEFQMRFNFAVRSADPAYAASLLSSARGAAVLRTDLEARLNLPALIGQRDTGTPADIFDPLVGYELPSAWLDTFVQDHPPVPDLSSAGFTFYLVNLEGLDDPANGVDHWFVRPTSDTDSGRVQDWWRLEWDNNLNTPMGYPLNIFGGPNHRVFIDPTAYQWYLDWAYVWWYGGNERAPFGYEYEETPIVDRPQSLADRVNYLLEGLAAELPWIPPQESRLRIRNYVLDGSPTVPASDLSWVVHDSVLLDYLAAFLPMKEWSIESTIEPVSALPTLSAVVDEYTTYRDGHGYIDGEAVWTYLYDHKSDFVADEPDTDEILTVSFVYDDRSMVYAGYEYTGLGGSGITAIFMQTHRLFTSDGEPQKGLTNTIAHETGHSLGYGHQWGWNFYADFVDGTMGYFREELTYGTFWEDALYRVYIREKQLELLDLLAHRDPLDLGALLKVFYEDYQGLRFLEAYNDLVALEVYVTEVSPPITSIEHAWDGNGVALTPGATTVSDSATFEFTATGSESVAGFVCTLDGIGSSCSSPVTYTGLSAGAHSFQVYAYDSEGRFSSPPPELSWTLLTPLDATRGLESYLASLPLATGVKSSLSDPLHVVENLLTAAKAGYEAKACRQLDAFVAQVTLYESKGRIPPDLATNLRNDAVAIGLALCPP